MVCDPGDQSVSAGRNNLTESGRQQQQGSNRALVQCYAHWSLLTPVIQLTKQLTCNIGHHQGHHGNIWSGSRLGPTTCNSKAVLGMWTLFSNIQTVFYQRSFHCNLQRKEVESRAQSTVNMHGAVYVLWSECQGSSALRSYSRCLDFSHTN